LPSVGSWSWSIGREILVRQQTEGWGARVIDRLGADLQKEFPGVEGYSPRNLKYMRSLAEAWPDAEIVPQLVALLPWGHLRVLLDQLKDRQEREWYLRAAVEYGWSRNVLVLQIKSGLREREGKAITNFQRALPPPDSDLAEQVLKDPYNFDFLTVTREAHEREIERGLLIHLRDLLLELGRGSPSSAARSHLRSGMKPSTSTCSSTTFASTATSLSNSRPGSSNRSGPASSTSISQR
jgi:predicted nuclease of restriction endonuclease-like (RecB) superfamily